MSASATLVVSGWDTSQAWFPGMDSYVKEMMLKYLQLSSPMARTEAKRIVKLALSRKPLSIHLVDGQHAHALQHWLQSIGAQVEVFVEGEHA